MQQNPQSLASTLVSPADPKYAPGTSETLLFVKAAGADKIFKILGFKSGTNKINFNLNEIDDVGYVYREYSVNGDDYGVFIRKVQVSESDYLTVQLSDRRDDSPYFPRIWAFAYSVRDPRDPNKSLGSRTHHLFWFGIHFLVGWNKFLNWEEVSQAVAGMNPASLEVDFTITYRLKAIKPENK